MHMKKIQADHVTDYTYASLHLSWELEDFFKNYNNNDRLTAFDPGQPG